MAGLTEEEMISPATQEKKRTTQPNRGFWNRTLRSFLLYLVTVFSFFGAQVHNAEAQTTITRYVDRDCTNNGDGTASTCAASPGAVGAYTNFCNAESDITTDYPNLVTSDVVIDVLMAGTTADTCGPIVNGQTTDATRYLRFRCDPNKGDGCNNTGQWSTSHYRLSTANADATLGIQDEYVRIEGIQIENTGLADASNRRCGIEINNTANDTDIRILGNIIRFNGTGSKSDNNGINNRGSYTGTIVNNIIYGWTGVGIGVTPKDHVSAITAVYNNTVYGNGTNIALNGSVNVNDRVRMFNNIMNGATTADYTISGSLTSLTTGNNISEDTTSPDTTFRSKAVTFQNEAGRNLLLSSSDTQAKDSGSDRSADTTYAFSTDILGATRPINGTWDIGAHEETTVAPTPTPTPTPPPTDAGCSVDTDRNGTVSSWCTTHADKDRDGFAPTQGDCDDLDPFVWPGAPLDVNGCPGGQWRQCQANGNGWTSCTATGYLQEATGSGRNLFIDPVAGNDTTGTGSQAQPWQSFAKIGYYASGAPSGHANFIRGDVIYVMNGNVPSYNPNHPDAGTVVSVATRNLATSGTTPIRIRNFPGHRPMFQGKVHVEGTAYFNIEGIDLDSTAGITKGIQYIAGAAGADDGRIVNVRIYDVDGSQGSNVAGIELHTSARILVQSAEIYDAYDRTNVGSNSENNSGLNMFRVAEPTLRGVKVVNQNPYSNCIKLKHQDSTAAGKPPVIDTATCYNTHTTSTGYIFGFNGSAIVRKSLAFGNVLTQPFFRQADLGGPTYFADGSIFEDNTCTNCTLGSLDPSDDDAAISTSVFRRNIIVDTSASGRTVDLLDRGSDGCFTNIVTGGLYTWTNNCYHTPNKTFNAGLFASTSTALYCLAAPTTTTSGATYASFAAWQSAGYDSGSFNKNPVLTGQFLATDSQCATFGLDAAASSSTGGQSFLLLGVQ